MSGRDRVRARHLKNCENRARGKRKLCQRRAAAAAEKTTQPRARGELSSAAILLTPYGSQGYFRASGFRFSRWADMKCFASSLM